MVLSNDKDLENEYARSFFMHERSRTNSVYKCELMFACVIAISGIIEILAYDSLTIALLMFFSAIVFVALYFELYFGSLYNCVALLNLHTYSAGLLGFTCWFACLTPLLFWDLVYLAGEETKPEFHKYFACLIIFGALLMSFAITSYIRAKEINAVELSFIDHIHRLLLKTFELTEEVREEGKQLKLKPKDVYSIT